MFCGARTGFYSKKVLKQQICFPKVNKEGNCIHLITVQCVGQTSEHLVIVELNVLFFDLFKCLAVLPSPLLGIYGKYLRQSLLSYGQK